MSPGSQVPCAGSHAGTPSVIARDWRVANSRKRTGFFSTSLAPASRAATAKSR
jgi:hypothetical protein